MLSKLIGQIFILHKMGNDDESLADIQAHNKLIAQVKVMLKQ